jgi:hypothetical protein
MATKAEKVKEIAASLGKSERAIWYWTSQGCDIGNPESVRQFVEGKRHRRTNVQRARERVERAFETAEAAINPIRDAVAGNNALFDKALKMGPDLLFADLLAGLCNQEPERPLDPFWIRHADYGRFSNARMPEDYVLKL